MQGFEDVTVSWKGEDFTIPANRQLLLVAQIEDALAGGTGQQAISVLLRPEGPPYARIAMAFGAALRFGGASVTDDEIYLSMMEDLARDKADAVIAVQTSIMALLTIVSPPMGRALAGFAEKKSKAETPKVKKAKE